MTLCLKCGKRKKTDKGSLCRSCLNQTRCIPQVLLARELIPQNQFTLSNIDINSACQASVGPLWMGSFQGHDV